jgi:hypothetical protein
LLKRPDWQLRPCQKWFEDDEHNQYYCPQGNVLVDFCDEMHFSRIAMYLKGRQSLENKTLLALLAQNLMPETYHILNKQWVDGRCPVHDEVDALPWFVKEADRNEGTFVECCQLASGCMDLVSSVGAYIVQHHVRDALTFETRKFHIRLHVLIMCMEDGKTWTVFTYKDGYLNISPVQWDPGDISRDTQVVIYRSRRIGDWAPWADIYPKCKSSVVEVIERAVAQGKLEGRLGKKQFEIASCDYMVDTHGRAWLLEINMGPVLRDSHIDPELNDDAMIESAFDIIIPWEDPIDTGLWDFACEIVGEAPFPATSTDIASAPELPATNMEELINDTAVDAIMEFLDGLA